MVELNLSALFFVLLVPCYSCRRMCLLYYEDLAHCFKEECLTIYCLFKRIRIKRFCTALAERPITFPISL